MAAGAAASALPMPKSFSPASLIKLNMPMVLLLALVVEIEETHRAA
jgi:hypothetical protein